MSDTTEQKFYDTKDFQKLDAKWQEKLKKSGFRDIEYRVAGKPGDYMVGPNPEYFIRRYSPDKEFYFECATQWTWHLRRSQWGQKTPEGRRAVRIWALHSQGNSFADIVKSTDFTRGVVARVVRDQKKAMLEAVKTHARPFQPETPSEGDPSWA